MLGAGGSGKSTVSRCSVSFQLVEGRGEAHLLLPSLPSFSSFLPCSVRPQVLKVCTAVFKYAFTLLRLNVQMNSDHDAPSLPFFLPSLAGYASAPFGSFQ